MQPLKIDKIHDVREKMKKYAVGIIVVLIVAAGIFFFFYYFSHGDEVKLAEFSDAYTKFDQASANYSKNGSAPNPGGAAAAGGLERNVDAALARLKSKAAARISSLTRHDGDLMIVMVEIGDLSAKELDALKSYQSSAASKNANVAMLLQEFNALTSQRQAAYARFRELTGQNK